MSEWINAPSSTRKISIKILHDKCMTHRHLIERIHVRCGGLIVHHPAAIRELQLTARHEGTNQVLCFGRLLMPPRGEKSLFYLDESSIRGCSNRWHDGVQYVLNGCGLKGRRRMRWMRKSTAESEQKLTIKIHGIKEGQLGDLSLYRRTSLKASALLSNTYAHIVSPTRMVLLLPI